MPEFILDTEECVHGRYRVSAPTEAQARKLLERTGGIAGACDDEVEQLSYEAYCVQVTAVAPAEE